MKFAGIIQTIPNLTGATMLSIGEDIAEQLGIKKEKEVYVSLAEGIKRGQARKGYLKFSC